MEFLSGSALLKLWNFQTKTHKDKRLFTILNPALWKNRAMPPPPTSLTIVGVQKKLVII